MTPGLIQIGRSQLLKGPGHAFGGAIFGCVAAVRVVPHQPADEALAVIEINGRLSHGHLQTSKDTATEDRERRSQAAEVRG